MAELSTLINTARIRTRTSAVRSNLVTDSNLLVLANSILEECRAKMIEVESNLVYSTGDITTVDGTGEYAISDHLTGFDGFLIDGVWLDGEDWFLQSTVEEDKINYDYASSTNQPEKYYITQDDKVGFLWVPDDAYTIHTQFWVVLTQLTATTGDGSTVPWGSVWNEFITKRLEYEINSIYERDVSRIAAELVGLEAEAMNRVYRYGIRKRRSQSDFFSVEGV